MGSLERGQSSNRRRIAIANRSSPAPTPMGDDDDSDSGKGMRSEKGTGTKSSKSSYGLYDLSMSMELGKGMKMEKFTKRGKSDKAAKNLKKEKQGDPDMSPTLGPLAPSTAPPTSADSISQKSKPFEITYSPLTDVPSTRDFQELTMITQTYLEVYMMNFFAETSLTSFDNFLTIMVRHEFDDGELSPSRFESNGLFSPDSIFIPTRREIDNLIEDSIMQKDYLKMVQSLPRSNPFSRTEKIDINMVSDAESNKATSEEHASSGSSSERSSSSVKAGVAAAAAGVIVLAASLAMLRRGRQSDGHDCDEVQDFSAHKVTYEDSTIADETCNMSVDDSSSHFAHFNRYESEGSEFQDEPLDSDDEFRKMTSAASSRS